MLFYALNMSPNILKERHFALSLNIVLTAPVEYIFKTIMIGLGHL